jgi:hypothetical protein
MTTATTTDLETITKRIRALLDLARNDGATPDEAATAAAKAQGLMLRYNIDRARIDAAAGHKAEYINHITSLDVASGPYINPHRQLLANLAAYNFCKQIQWSGSARVALIGEQHNVDLVLTLYHSLAADLSAMAERSWKATQHTDAAWYWDRDKHEYIKHTGITYKAEYYRGAVEAIRTRLYKQRCEAEDAKAAEAKAREQQDTHDVHDTAHTIAEAIESAHEVRALVLVKDAELEQAQSRYYPKLGKARAKRTPHRSESAAYGHGRRDGMHADLNAHKRLA